jgi:addiction module RelE/StbE family toxin
MRLRWLKASVADLDEIFDYVAEDDVQAAARVLERIERAVNALKRHPELGRSGRVAGTREFVVAGLPYLVVYRISPSHKIEILAVRHAARRWPHSF